VQEVRRRRLPVRAGDPGHLELLRRLAEEGIGGDRHRGAGVVDDELRDSVLVLRQLDRVLHDERDRPVLDRLGREVVPVGPLARHAEERRTRRHRPSVVGELAHLDWLLPENRLRRERGDQALELHGRRVYRGAVASGAISRYWSPKRAIFEKAGAATTPPQIAFRGSSTETRTTSRGSFAGTTPANEAT